MNQVFTYDRTGATPQERVHTALSQEATQGRALEIAKGVFNEIFKTGVVYPYENDDEHAFRTDLCYLSGMRIGSLSDEDQDLVINRTDELGAGALADLFVFKGSVEEVKERAAATDNGKEFISYENMVQAVQTGKLGTVRTILNEVLGEPRVAQLMTTIGQDAYKHEVAVLNVITDASAADVFDDMFKAAVEQSQSGSQTDYQGEYQMAYRAILTVVCRGFLSMNPVQRDEYMRYVNTEPLKALFLLFDALDFNSVLFSFFQGYAQIHKAGQ